MRFLNQGDKRAMLHEPGETQTRDNKASETDLAAETQLSPKCYPSAILPWALKVRLICVRLSKCMNLFLYICMHMCVCVFVCVCVSIYFGVYNFPHASGDSV